MTNPYDPPSAVLSDDQTENRRPAWVWVISIFYGLSAISSLVTTPLMLSGVLPVPEPEASQLAAVGPAQWVFSLGGGALLLAFSITFFRLRAVSVRLLAGVLGLSVVSSAWQLAVADLTSSAFGELAILTTLFGFGLLVCIYLYARRLRSRGVLSHGRGNP